MPWETASGKPDASSLTGEASSEEQQQANAQKQAQPSAQVKQQYADRMIPRIVEIRQRRRQIDEEDLRSHAMWKGVRLRFMYESDQFKHYLPMGRRAIEKLVIRVTQLLYPSSDYFEVYPGDEIDLQKGKEAAGVLGWMRFLLDKKIQIRKIIAQLVRSLLIFRRAILKTNITLIDAPVISMNQKRARLRQVWPSARVVDAMSFYVWPETATSISECQLIFEDVMMPWNEYESFMAQGVVDPIDRDDLTTPEWPYHLIQRMAYSGLTDPSGSQTTYALAQEKSTLYDSAGRPIKNVAPKAAQTFVAITEVWTPTAQGWYQAWIAWNVSPNPRCVRLQPSEYPEPVYLWANMRSLPNETYTTGAGNDLEPLNILLNDQVNQGEEARSVSALPPALVNTELIGRADALVFGPRKKWPVTDVVNSVKMLDIPDTSAQSQRAIMITQGWIDNIAGATPLVQGQPQRGLPRAGGAVNQMIQLGMADIQDLASILETEILTPMLAQLHRLTLLFVPRSQVLSVPGTINSAPMTMSVDELYGNWTFNWVGAIQAQANQVKAQQMLVFMQSAAKIMPILAQQGWALNWGVIAKRMWRESLGERGVEQIIVPITDLPQVNPAAAALIQMQLQAQMAQAQQQAMGGGMAGPQPATGQMPPASQADAAASQGRSMATPSLTQSLSGNG